MNEVQTQKFRTGDIAYLVESNRFIQEGKVGRCRGGLYMYHFIEGGAIRVHEHRLYPSEEAAQAYLDTFKAKKKTPAFWEH